MAKKKGNLLNNRVVIIVFAAALVVFGGALLLTNFPVTGYASRCPAGTYIFSAHVDGNRDGYIAPIEAADVVLKSSSTACTYEISTDNNGDANVKVVPGSYDVRVTKQGKCSPHRETIVVAGSDLYNFRLDGCKRNFQVR